MEISDSKISHLVRYPCNLIIQKEWLPLDAPFDVTFDADVAVASASAAIVDV